jgi:hypothetical protein
MNRKIVSLFISLFYFQAQSQNNWTSKKDKIKIPFELTHNIIIIDVVFNGTNLKMIADTGSSRNMIFSVPENDSLIINKANKIFISGVGLNENIEGFLSQNNSISIKDYIDDKFEVVLINNHEISIVNKLGIPINGIIGSSFFKHFLVEIDYQRKLIILHKNKEAKLAKIKKKYAKSEISITESKPYINLLTKIENKEKKLNLLFDTGLGDGLWLFENDSIQCNSNFFIDFLGRGLSGDIKGKKARIEEVSFQNNSLKNVLVSYPEIQYFDQIKMTKYRNGSIGGEITKRFNWFLDYENNVFYFKKNTHFDLPFEYNMAGIEVQHAGSQWIKEEIRDTSPFVSVKRDEIIFENSNLKYNFKYELKPIFEIYSIRENSPAAKIGLKVGDKIVKLNSTNSKYLNIQFITNLFQSEDGKQISISVERQGKILEFKFRLEKLL